MEGLVLRTIVSPGTGQIKVRGSTFTSRSFPASSVEDALQLIDAVRRSDSSATHHCYAFRLGLSGAQYRFNDDGEPSGTAGQPIFRQLTARRLTDIALVVTRHFGGTKLGTGGLVRAYADAAALALEDCRFVDVIETGRLTLRFDYDDTASVMRLLSKFDGDVVSSSYSTYTTLEFQLAMSRMDEFLAAFTDALSGRGSALRVEV